MKNEDQREETERDYDVAGWSHEVAIDSCKFFMAVMLGHADSPAYDGLENFTVPKDMVGSVLTAAAIRELAMEVRRLRWHLENHSE